jgi:HipA-like protein
MGKRISERLHEWLASWGMPGAPAPRGPSARVIHVHGPWSGGARVLVGQLSHEGQEWVFRYADSYRQGENPPIAAFPYMQDEYRSTRLWPFFEVRLPPLDRDDVEAVLKHRGIDKSDMFTLLAVLGARIATSPYELELVEQRVPASRLATAT